MAAQSYVFGPGSFIPEQLGNEVAAAGLPPCQVFGSNFPSPGKPAQFVELRFDPPLDAAQEAQLNGVVAAHVPNVPRRPRLLFAIWTDLGALTAAQKTAIWADLSAGNPPKFTQDRGANASSLLVLFTLQQLGGLSVSDKALCKQSAAAIFCLDNPAYLVHPAFDPTLNVPGDEPIP